MADIVSVTPAVVSAMDTFLDAKTWPGGVSVLREHSELLLTEIACDELRARIARERRTFFWRRGRRVRRLQRHLDFLEDARQNGIDGAWRNFVLTAVRKHPMGETYLSAARQIPQVEEFMDSWIQGMLEGRDIAQERMNLLTKQIGENTLDGRWLAEYAQRLGRKYGRSRSPRAIFQTQQFIMQLGAVIELSQAIQQLTEMREEPGVFERDLAARKLLLAEQLLAGFTNIRDPFVRAAGQIMVAETQYDAARTYPDQIRQPYLEQCAVLMESASRVLLRYRLRFTWGGAQEKLSNIYSSLNAITGTYRSLQIKALQNALKGISRRDHPEEWASLQSDLGAAFNSGWRSERDLQQAIRAYQRALDVYTTVEHDGVRALAHYHLGYVYLVRHQSNRQRNLKEAIAHFDQALEFFRPELVILYDECHIGRAQALEELGRLDEAHASLIEARRLQDVFLERSNTTAGAMNFSRRSMGDLYLRDVRVLLKAPTVNREEIVTTLEEGQARIVSSVLSLDRISLQQIDSTALAELMTVRSAWQMAQTEYNASFPSRFQANDIEAIQIRGERWLKLSETHDAFVRVRDAIRERYPTFLSPVPTFAQVAEAVTARDEALVYLATGDMSGLAVIVTRAPDDSPQVDILELPALTQTRVDTLLFGTDQPSLDYAPHPHIRPARGYYYTQIGDALTPLERWGRSIIQTLKRLPSDSSFRAAIRAIVTSYTGRYELFEILDKPFESLSGKEYAILARIFNQELLRVELPEMITRLGSGGLSLVAQWLEKRCIRKVALAPYGRIGLFPLPAVLVETSSGMAQFAEKFEVSIVPSARAYQITTERAHALDYTTRPAMFLAGDPELPEWRRHLQLPYAEAEPGAIASIAHEYAQRCTPEERGRHGLGKIGSVLTRAEVTKANVVNGFTDAWFVALAAHGRYLPDSPLQSTIDLANGDTITLEECLSGAVKIEGVRLVILSACDLSIIDVTKAENESLGLATGFIMAGAAAVIAPLWAIDDRATFLLISRFCELYLDPHAPRSPAGALAEAQHWLREEANNAVLSQYKPLTVVKTAPTGEPAIRHIRSLRMVYDDAIDEIHQRAAASRPDARPYAHPMYWAGFVVTGS